MKNEKQIDEMWDEHLSGRDMPTQDEIDKQVLETLYTELESQEDTNYAMYKTIMLLFETNGGGLDFTVINKDFNLENRTEHDLKNLKEFIICITLMCGRDVLKAQITNNKTFEKAEIVKYRNRCELMNIIIQAVDSVIVTLN